MCWYFLLGGCWVFFKQAFTWYIFLIDFLDSTEEHARKDENRDFGYFWYLISVIRWYRIPCVSFSTIASISRLLYRFQYYVLERCRVRVGVSEMIFVLWSFQRVRHSSIQREASPTDTYSNLPSHATASHVSSDMDMSFMAGGEGGDRSPHSSSTPTLASGKPEHHLWN